MVLTDQNGQVLFSSPANARQLRGHHPPVRAGQAPGGRPGGGILADAGYQGLGAQTGGRMVTPPHRKFKKNAPDCYKETHERQRKAHSSTRTRVEHGTAHMKNWWALTHHLGRREHTSDTVQAIAGLLSHQQTADLSPPRHDSCEHTCYRSPRRLTTYHARARKPSPLLIRKISPPHVPGTSSQRERHTTHRTGLACGAVTVLLPHGPCLS
ncbi:hypothetical protein [Streptomyces sp. NPDC048266]|uniref:hypothetical protein n=1 Tax=Streptomyces sp. NPDC048266 TaxID=3155787 RepID=UPI003408D1FF